MAEQNATTHDRNKSTSSGNEGIDVNESMGRSNLPVHEVRMGRISAAIWVQDTQFGPRHNVTVSRLYKLGEEWKRSDSFGRDDIPLLCKVLDRAHDWIFQQAQSRGDEDSH